jgi:hypothetical protein
MYKFSKPYTPAGLEPGIICSAGGRDDHYTTPLGCHEVIYIVVICYIFPPTYTYMYIHGVKKSGIAEWKLINSSGFDADKTQVKIGGGNIDARAGKVCEKQFWQKKRS